MRLFLIFSFAIFVVACSSAEKEIESDKTVAPVASPTPIPEIVPAGPSKMNEADSKYALYLEKVFANLRSGREERILVDYIRYLHYGEEKYARTYIEALKKEATNREGLIPNLDIFEGAYAFCEFQKDVCVRSLGSLTQSYFLPRLKSGDPVALELFVVHGGTTDRDGAEAEGFEDTESSADVAKYSRLISDFKKKYRKLFQSIR